MNELKLELAQLAARHIAEEGLSYGQAKRKAAKQSGIAESSAAMPDNPTIEAALREYQAQFQADTQPQELRRLRKLALQWMSELARLQGLEVACQTLAVGAVVNGTANEHSAVHLQIFTDEDKYLEMGLLNAGIQTTPSEQKIEGKFRPILVADDGGTPVVLTLFPLASYAPPKIVPIGEYAQLANAAQLSHIMECS